MQSYSLPAVMPVPSSSLFPPPPLPHLVIHRNIIRRFCSSVPFSEKRDLHLFVRFIHATLSRASGRFTFIYTNVYGGGIFQPIFRLAPPLFFLFFLFFLFTLATAETCIIRALETPDRYRRVSRDNFFFYHSETTVVAPAKRSRQHIHAT